jgi:tetratricopeptide (TPR) repeat protein
MQHSLTRLLMVLCLFWPMTSSFAADQDLDELFNKLKIAPNETIAEEYANSIWEIWFQSGDSKVDELMQQAMSKRRSANYDDAIKILDQVIALKPDYAEGWNQRATLYFLKEEYEKSLEDVAKTLELEPRHFGALSGRAIIRLKQGKPALAVQNLLKAIEIHPFLAERSLLDQIDLGI